MAGISWGTGATPNPQIGSIAYQFLNFLCYYNSEKKAIERGTQAAPATI
jgi:hypothetical protein